MIKCLLIDDDRDDHEIFEMAMQAIDDEIACSMLTDGSEGLEFLEKNAAWQPDIIFLDLNMPGMGGIEFLEKYNGSSLGRVPVVIYSTSDEASFRRQAQELGAARYMVKTATMRTLIDELKQTFNLVLHRQY